MTDEIGRRWWMRGYESRGERWPARRQTRGDDQWSDLPISHKIGNGSRRDETMADEGLREGNGSGQKRVMALESHYLVTHTYHHGFLCYPN